MLKNFEADELELLAQVLIEDSNWLDSFHSSAQSCCNDAGVTMTSSNSECERIVEAQGDNSVFQSEDTQILRRAFSSPELRPDCLPESQVLQASTLKSRLTAPARNCITAKNIGLLKRATSSCLCAQGGGTGVYHDVEFKSARPARPTHSKSPRRTGLIPIDMLID
jgi:hypothetical protein